MANMIAYPGRTFGQLYHQFFRVERALRRPPDDCPTARSTWPTVGVPVLSVAGNTDVLAPRPRCTTSANLLPNAPDVRLETAPGGHLGVLTGGAAAGDDLAVPRRVPAGVGRSLTRRATERRGQRVRPLVP